MKSPLPIDPLVPQIVESLARAPGLVIEAPPGAGKTTRVPPALLAAGSGDVLVLEPRRLATRLAARRVAAELGEAPGGLVGYQVRLESVGGRHTRLWYLTEGVLTRRLVDDPELAGVSTVVLDEFHERHLEGDFALALLRRLQGRRRDLRLVVMSATLDAAPVAEFLGGCPMVRSEGRLHPLEIRYTPQSPQPLEEQVRGALERLIREGLDGDVLVFLPGAAEIRRSMRACERLASHHGLLLAALHGDLAPEEQDRAIAPAAAPKVVFSTNVAESSVTIEGVTAVIDSGLARVASDSPWSGLPRLKVSRISKASAIQRAGRAGRVRAGRVIRLYPEEDFLRRPERDAPEISRRELSQLVLQAHACGVADLTRLAWLDEPPAAALSSAETLLAQLGALDRQGRLTEAGRRMAALPVHPRLARLIVAADARGAGVAACEVAARLSEGERLNMHTSLPSSPSDLLAILDQPASPGVRRLAAHLRRLARPRPSQSSSDEPLLKAVLEAFPDRVARRRRAAELLLASGGAALLAQESVVRNHELLVAVDVEERPERGLPLVRLASAIEPEWLLDLFPDRLVERRRLEWNRMAERVEAVSELVFDAIVIEQTSGAAPEPEEAARLLAEKAREAGLERFVDRQALDAFLARVAFAAPYLGIEPLTETDAEEALAALCRNLRSFADLERAAADGFFEQLRRRLAPGALKALDEVAPEFIRLPGGRRLRVHYEGGGQPWIASRLQDFFGLRETPRIAGGAQPLLIRLLAPNQRPVQTTTDLAGFWERLYPQVRRELARRYPKHAWPERPV